jgi:hypothetical protein
MGKRSEFTKRAHQKGWTLKELAVRWGVSVRWMSNISQDPQDKDWDALEGLPDKEGLNEWLKSRM